MSIEQSGEPGEGRITPIQLDSTITPVQTELSAEEIRVEVARREDEKNQRLADLARHKVERILKELPAKPGIDRFDQIRQLMGQEQVDHYRAEDATQDSDVRSELRDGYSRRRQLFKTALRAELEQLEADEPGTAGRKYGELISRQLQGRWHPGSGVGDLIYGRYSGYPSFEDEGEALPGEELTQVVDLDRVIKSNDLLSWDGTSLPGVMKQAYGRGLMDSRAYIVELAATMLTGEYTYEGKQGTNNINLNRYHLPNGQVVYSVGLGQHRTATLKLLGRRFVPANIT